MAVRADRVVDRLLDGAQPRADARRNLRKLVEAAERAVAEIGTHVTAHDIAARAGVGIGTFYRRVGSREALLEAVLLETVAELVSLAEAALKEPDPLLAVRRFAEGYVQLRMISCGLNAALAADAAPPLEPYLARLRALLDQIVHHAQEQGALRPDVTGTDVAFLLASVTVDQQTIGLRATAHQWRRTLDVLLDGLAAPSPTAPYSTHRPRS